MSGSYYNEFDPHAAAWLRELIKAGEIAPGDVDERSITDVDANELAGYTQLHFFAGIGGWSRALRLAGIPDSEPIVTGSCPCQPFSSAGKGDGFDDPRHLWPHFFRIIRHLRPARVVGEQVASPDALVWWDAVCADLEGAGYAGWAADLCSACIGAPHIRQRLYWVADAEHHGDRGQAEPADHHGPQADRSTDQRGGCGGASGRLADSIGAGLERRREGSPPPTGQWRSSAGPATEGGGAGRLADAHQVGRKPLSSAGQPGEERDVEPRGGVCRLADAAGNRLHGPARQDGQQDAGGIGQGWADATRGRQDGDERPRPPHGIRRDADWLHCRDGKWRPVKPGLVPLVDGLPRGVVPSSRIGLAIDADRSSEARAMRLKGYGNAIDPELAAMFLRAVS